MDPENLSIYKGNILNEKYLLIYELGKGGYASVWLALAIKTSKFYAIKIQFADEYDNGIDEMKTFKKINNLNCPYINTIVDDFVYKSPVVKDNEHVCMVFELMAGSLYDIIKVGKYSKGLPADVVIKIIKQVSIAMDVINKKLKIIHSDIKPDNILLCGVNNKIKEIIDKFNSDKNIKSILKKKNKLQGIKKLIVNLDFSEIDEKYSKKNSLINPDLNFIDDSYIENVHIKLSDFGTFRDIKYNKFDIHTRYYRAPEIILRYDYNEKCDIWSLGCTIYELLTGKLLFDPVKTPRYTRQKNHIYQMICTLGPIPDNILDTADKKTDFFTKNNLIRGVYNIESETIRDKLINKIGSDVHFDILLQLINRCLNYNVNDRPSPKELISIASM